MVYYMQSLDTFPLYVSYLSATLSRAGTGVGDWYLDTESGCHLVLSEPELVLKHIDIEVEGYLRF